jgi:peroxiredoxin
VKNSLIALIVMSSFALSAQARAEVKIGAPAPDFSEKDGAGKTHALKDYKGKWVVLEWYNKDCPYVKKHYGSGNMQKLQKDATAKGAVWLTVNSGKKGKQGYLDAAGTLKQAKETGSNAAAVLVDSDSSMGKAYDAKTTPHMFVINPEGNVVYAGAIDDNDSSDPEVIPASKNYVAAALEAGMNGKPIETATSKPYGCGVKY